MKHIKYILLGLVPLTILAIIIACVITWPRTGCCIIIGMALLALAYRIGEAFDDIKKPKNYKKP